MESDDDVADDKFSSILPASSPAPARTMLSDWEMLPELLPELSSASHSFQASMAVFALYPGTTEIFEQSFLLSLQVMKRKPSQTEKGGHWFEYIVLPVRGESALRHFRKPDVLSKRPRLEQVVHFVEPMKEQKKRHVPYGFAKCSERMTRDALHHPFVAVHRRNRNAPCSIPQRGTFSYLE